MINDKQGSKIAVLRRLPPSFVVNRSAIQLVLCPPASHVIAQLSRGKSVVGIRV